LYSDPRLALLIGYNPSIDFLHTIIPVTPDPRPYEDRILTAFLDTPGVRACTVALEDNPHPPPVSGFAGQADKVIVYAECTIEPTHNTIQFAEWLRRLANRALLDTNVIICEELWVCDSILELPVMELVLDDGETHLHYQWNARTWIIAAE
jgi:hypothetical protein